MSRTEYDENNSHYSEYNGRNNNYYSDNNGNGNYYGNNGSGNGNYYGNNGSGNGNYYGNNGSGNGNYYGNNGSGNGNYYGNNSFGNGNYNGNGANTGDYYGAGGYYGNTCANADVESKVITRSFIVMFISLLVTAFTATIVASNIDIFVSVINSFGVLLIIELFVVFAASYAVKRKIAIVAGIFYTIYTIINGMTFSVIFFAYELGSVQDIFIMTALLFGVMAVIGATTKIDLTRVGGVCTMLLLGALIVTFANMLFLHSTGLDLILDYVIVGIFIGFTAYDTQKMKVLAANAGSSDVNIIAIYCGMELYLDFINLFIRLLSIFGKKRN